MRVERVRLKEGFIADEDVRLKTDRPIIRKNTVLTKKHLDVLEAFLIKEISVKLTDIHGDEQAVKKQSKHNKEKENETQVDRTQDAFTTRYLRAVKEYKQLFSSWKSGGRIDIFQLRKLVIPLLESAVEQPKQIFFIHQLSVKEEYLYHHAVATSMLSAFIGKQLGYSKGDWLQIGLAGALCDSGMARISQRLIDKNGSLTDSEYKEIKQHPINSYHMVKNLPAIQEGVSLAVSQHHEREDGSGYPLKMDHRQIHPYSKIVAAADAFHAMTSERHYRSKQSPFKVLEEMTRKQFGLFEHRVLDVLLNEFSRFSNGTKVRLTNDEVGEIVFTDKLTPTRPMVRLESNGEIIALTNQQSLYIQEILS